MTDGYVAAQPKTCQLARTLWSTGEGDGVVVGLANLTVTDWPLVYNIITVRSPWDPGMLAAAYAEFHQR